MADYRNLTLKDLTILHSFIDRITIFITSGFGIGYISYAQGTFGTILGLILIILLTSLSVKITIIFLIFFTIFGIILCGRANKIYKKNDSRHIVLDEIIGIFIATYNIQLSFNNFFICFLLFRLFDILKPFPIFLIDQKLKNGYGIVLDDVVAGIFTNILFTIISVYLLNNL